jgi:hypothetical protein
MPLRPVGNKAACQPNSRSAVSGNSYLAVASSIISTTPFNVAICGRESTDIHSKAPRDRGAHLIPIEDFAFDLA